MSIEEGIAYPRINGELLRQFESRRASLLGNTDKIDNVFLLTTSDGVQVEVRFSGIKAAHHEIAETAGPYLVEVIGTVGKTNTDGRHSFSANNLTVFTVEQAENFDMEMYDSTVQLISDQDYKHFYPYGK